MITRLRHLLTLRCGRPLRDRRGAVMVEFALVVGPLLLLTFAIIELGLSYWAGGLLDNATQETARKIRTGELQAAAAGEETKTAQELFRENLCEAMDALIDCEDESRVYFDVRTFEDFEDVDMAPPETDDEDAGVIITQFQPGTREEVILVRTYFRWRLITPGVRYLAQNYTDAQGNLLLSSTVAFRNEPFPEIEEEEVAQVGN